MRTQYNQQVLVKSIAVYLLFAFYFSTPLYAKEIKIGVLSHVNIEQTRQQWQLTADYLTEKIPQHHFVIVPYRDLVKLTQAATNGDIEFVLTNPSSYVEMELLASASRLLTLRNKRVGGGYTQFGSVIFTKANRNDINKITDLKGKVFMGVSKNAFGGWQVPWYEFLKNNFDPYKELSEIRYANNNQEEVVFAVLKGDVDAGAVRTDMIERMALAEKLSVADIKVINPKLTKGFPFMHSTDLYPEWPFAKLKHTSYELAQQVIIALLQISPSDKAALSGNYVGWTTPLNYQPVHKMLKELGLRPYNVVTNLSLSKVTSLYWGVVTVVILTLFAAILIIYYIMGVNRRLRITKNDLEKQVIERKRAEVKMNDSRRMLQLVLDSIPARVFWKDKDLNFLGCNKLFAHDAGLETPKAIINKSDYEMVWAEQAELYRADDQAVMESGQSKLNYEEPQTTPDGKNIWLETSKVPLTNSDGSVVGILGAYTDITERKQAQFEKENYHARLEAMVAIRTAELELSNKELESYSYSIAHDLRAPLRSITGFSQILIEEAGSKLNDVELDALQRITYSGKHMAQLIDDILELARISRNKITKVKTNISDICFSVISELEKNYPDRKIDWHIEKNIDANGDEGLIRVVFQNLMENALKFTRDSKESVIEFGKEVQGQATVYFVKDNGVGFNMQYVDKLFIPFERLHSNEYEGTGVGLATVQRIVQRHGGDVWAKAEPNKGAEFYFTLT